ncbi:SusE domain-containing protein [Bacteroidota bacterium]
MKKIIYTIVALVGIVLFNSCEDNLELVTIAAPEDIVSASLNDISSSSYILEFENESETFETFTWTSADYGFNAAIDYTLQVAISGDNFTNPFDLGTNSDNELAITVSQINKGLTNLEAIPFEQTDVEFRLKAAVDGAIDAIYSEVITATITSYATDFEPIFMIGDAVLGWDTTKAVEVYGIGPSTYEVIAEFNNGGAFRFFDAPDWGANSYNWTFFSTGSIASDFENAGDGDTNIRFTGTTGYYKIGVNTKSLTITMTPVDQPALFMVGAGVPDAGWGWDTPVEMTWIKDGIFEATTTFSLDTFRFFSKDGDWGSGTNFPYYLSEEYEIDAIFEDAQDGDNNFRFIGTPGVYKIIVNQLEKTIVLAEPGSAGPPKYMVGAAVPDAGWGWDTPIEMVQTSAGVWTATTTFAVDAFRFFDTFGDWGSGTNHPFYVGESYTIDANFEDAQDGDNNFKFIGTPGEYTITLNSNTKTISLSN